MWAAPCPLMEGVRASSEPLWGGSRESAASGEWQIHLFILSFSYCKHLSAPWQVRDLPHTETLFTRLSSHTCSIWIWWDRSCAVVCLPSHRAMQTFPWHCSCSPFMVGRECQLQEPPVHRNGAMVAQSTVLVFDQKS